MEVTSEFRQGFGPSQRVVNGMTLQIVNLVELPIHKKDGAMKKFLLISAVLSCLLFLANCKNRVKKPPPPVATGNGETRAVSLNGLQQKLKACMPNGSCQQELLQLAGI